LQGLLLHKLNRLTHKELGHKGYKWLHQHI
jgi:hypothetical protein